MVNYRLAAGYPIPLLAHHRQSNSDSGCVSYPSDSLASLPSSVSSGTPPPHPLIDRNSMTIGMYSRGIPKQTPRPQVPRCMQSGTHRMHIDCQSWIHSGAVFWTAFLDHGRISITRVGWSPKPVEIPHLC